MNDNFRGPTGWPPCRVVMTQFRNEQIRKLTLIVQKTIVRMCPTFRNVTDLGTATNINQQSVYEDRHI